MANIFSNFGNKVGNAFTNLGQGNSLFGNQNQIANLSDEDKKRLQREGLERFANSIGVAAAIGSGDPQRIALAQNKIRQAKIDKEDAKKKEEQKKAIENYKKNNPDKADIIDAILGGVPASAVIPKTPPKKSKNDYVVEILEKIKNIPGYKLTETDQRILDTISDTDPMKIMIRDRLNEMQGSEFSNQNTNQSGPVTVTTQEQYDALPSGSLFIEDGQTYRKP